MAKYVKDVNGKFVGSIGEGKTKVPTVAKNVPVGRVLSKTTSSKATVASHKALLARMDTFALNITTSMDGAAKAAGRDTETGKLLGSWRHDVVSELLKLRNIFIEQHERINTLEAELVHPLNLPRVVKGFRSYRVDNVKGVSANETLDPDLVRKIGSGFIAIAEQMEKDQAAIAEAYIKEHKVKTVR